MNYLKPIFFLFAAIISSSAKAGDGFVFLGDTANKLFYVSGNEIYSPDKNDLLYFQKGNIFFNGSTDSKENIFLITTSMNVGSDDLELLYEKNSKRATYSFTKYKFYAGANETEDFMIKNEVLHVQRKTKWLAFYSSLNDSLLGYYLADSLPPATAVIVAYALIKKYKLATRLDEGQHRSPFNENAFSTIKPVLGNQVENEWLWDGKIFRPRWNPDPDRVWTFDGQTIKPQYSADANQQYEWNGEILKPTSQANEAEEWSWDEKLMKPVLDNDLANQYVIEKGVVKPASEGYPEKEWKIEGGNSHTCNNYDSERHG